MENVPQRKTNHKNISNIQATGHNPQRKTTTGTVQRRKMETKRRTNRIQKRNGVRSQHTKNN